MQTCNCECNQLDGKWKAVWALTNTASQVQSEKKIVLAIEASTTGWVGFGIAEAAGMRGADVIRTLRDAKAKTKSRPQMHSYP